jgi:hypothetical protein
MILCPLHASTTGSRGASATPRASSSRNLTSTPCSTTRRLSGEGTRPFPSHVARGRKEQHKTPITADRSSGARRTDTRSSLSPVRLADQLRPTHLAHPV